MPHEMESDLGIAGLSAPEKALLSAIVSVQQYVGKNTYIPSREIQSHPLFENMASPTFFRALQKLLEKKLLELPEGRAKGLYRLSDSMYFKK
jgi:hypothetical protein